MKSNQEESKEPRENQIERKNTMGWISAHQFQNRLSSSPPAFLLVLFVQLCSLSQYLFPRWFVLKNGSVLGNDRPWGSLEVFRTGFGGDGLDLILLGIRGAAVLLVKNTSFNLLLCRKNGEAGVLFVRHKEVVESLDSFSCEDDRLTRELFAGCVCFSLLTG